VAGYVYDARNKLAQIKRNNSLITQFNHDADGRVVKKELGNGLEEIYTYDAASKLTQMELRSIQNPANVLLRHNYGYDAAGNRIYTQYLDGTGDVYAYDATYQVIGVKYGVANPTAGYAAATGASRTVTYDYDAVGNRTSVLDGIATMTYSINNLNQYISVGGVNYSYAASGELLNDGTWNYSYDYAGRLVGAIKLGTNVSYGYDPIGRRTSKTVNGITTKYVYSGDDLIEERDASDNVLKQYVYANGIDRPVQVIIDSSVYYFTQDILGNIIALTDASGQIAEQYSYDVYGKPTIKDGADVIRNTALVPFLFTGREYDSEIGLYHYRARAYSPNLGRFLQTDSIGFHGGDLNLYRYVNNNPINRVDPHGTAACPPDEDDTNTEKREEDDPTAAIDLIVETQITENVSIGLFIFPGSTWHKNTNNFPHGGGAAIRLKF
jgi:RHS repeat-associated protein